MELAHGVLEGSVAEGFGERKKETERGRETIRVS
jgi:hypothetical protein